MATLKTRRAWDKRISLDDPVKMDENNVIHQAVKGQIIRDIRNGDYENMGNLQKVASLVSITTKSDPVKVDEKTVTVLKDGHGKVFETHDAMMVKSWVDAGMTIIDSRTEPVYDQ